MWAVKAHLACYNLHLNARKLILAGSWGRENICPVAVLDLRPEAVERAVEQMAKAMLESRRPKHDMLLYWQARAVLEALVGKLP